MLYYNYCSETGPYDNDSNFARHDAELEMKAANDEARFEHEAEEAHTRLWEGEDQMEMDRRHVTPAPIVPERKANPVVHFGMELSTTELLMRMRRPAARTKRTRRVA